MIATEASIVNPSRIFLTKVRDALKRNGITCRMRRRPTDGRIEITASVAYGPSILVRIFQVQDHCCLSESGSPLCHSDVVDRIKRRVRAR